VVFTCSSNSQDLSNGLVMSVLPLAVENKDAIWVRKLLSGSVITVICS